MPIGSIDPRTDTLTLSSMLLGSEEYPSSVQQAGEKNTGYLLYKPLIGHNDYGGTAVSAVAGTVTGELGYIYLLAGKYDVEVKFTADSTISIGTAWLTIGTVAVSSLHGIALAGTTIVETFTGATFTEGWYSLYAKAYSAETTEIYNVSSYLRQYE